MERISLSPYRDNLVLKGGFLIASLLGVDTRSTHDLDTTVIGMSIEPAHLMQVFIDICKILPINDPIELHPTKIESIRDDDKYGGYRVYFEGLIYDKIRPVFKIDVSTGDKITPREIKYRHQLITEDRSIVVLAYNLETILAEKLETIISRGVNNSHAKDFYDLYALTKLEAKNINLNDLKIALHNTATYRNTLNQIQNYEKTISEIVNNKKMQENWDKYQKANGFAQGITQLDTCNAVINLMHSIHWD